MKMENQSQTIQDRNKEYQNFYCEYNLRCLNFAVCFTGPIPFYQTEFDGSGITITVPNEKEQQYIENTDIIYVIL